MRYLVAFLILMIVHPACAAEPVPGDACTGFPAGSVMRSGGPELEGRVYVMTCSGGVWEGAAINPEPPPPDTINPVWTSAAGTVATIETGAALNAQINGTDENGGVTYSKQSGAVWIFVSAATGALTGTAPGTPGTYAVMVRLTDVAGNYTDRSFDIVVTVPPDTTPDTYTFADVTGVELNTLTPSAAVTIGGINMPTAVFVTGAGAQISIGGGAWATNGTIVNGQTMQVRLTSSGSYSTPLTATVNAGGVSDVWSVTTKAAPTCAGVWVGGYCWYKSAVNGSCTTACSTHGGYHTATKDYAGSSGSNANCQAVLDALGLTGDPVYSGSWGTGVGCGKNSVRWRELTPATTAGASYPDNITRACACNN